MKVFALIGLASAATTDWMLNTWWDEAKNVFNFASNNWDTFKSVADGVDNAKWTPLWNFCNPNGDSAITSDELIACGAKAAAFGEMPKEYQNYVYEFASKYFSSIDLDNSGDLSYDEYKYTMAGFAAVDGRVIMKAFDADENGLLDASELHKWRAFAEEVMTQWKWEATPAHMQAMQSAWTDAKLNSNMKSASMVEVSRFMVNVWNVLLS